MAATLLCIVFFSLCALICNFSEAGVIVSNKFEKKIQETKSIKDNATSSLRSARSILSTSGNLRYQEIGSANPFCHPVTFRDRLLDLRNVERNCLQELVFDDCCQPRFLQLLTTGMYPIHYGKQGYGYCDMETDGGGWIVLVRRMGGRRSFDKTWKQYKRGFGPIDRDFWIGLDSMFKLTRTSSEMRIDLVHANGSRYHAYYDHFSVGPEISNYTLTVRGYNAAKSNIFDALSEHSGAQFTTKDRDNAKEMDPRRQCWNRSSTMAAGGWWFLNGSKYYCHRTNLNGPYFIEASNETFRLGVPWRPILTDTPVGVLSTSYHYEFAELKIRPKSWECGWLQKDWESVQRLFLAKENQEEEKEVEEVVETPTAPSTPTSQ